MDQDYLSIKKTHDLLTITIVLIVLIISILSIFLFLTLTNRQPPINISQSSIEKAQQSIVWVKYRVSGKHRDGTYFENAGGSGSGILFSKKDDRYFIITNRHVIDCLYQSNSCYQRISENISVRTQDGKIHPAKRTLFAPDNIDIAVIEISVKEGIYPIAKKRTSDLRLSEQVFAIGYPRFVQGFTEFSTSKGRILSVREVITSDGFGFNTIESNAYTNFGSSGGGLFDKDGNLIGINTWKSQETSIAVKSNILERISSYSYCQEGFYYTDQGCALYCDRNQVLGKNNQCFDKCDSYFCDSFVPQISSDQCNPGYVLGQDKKCHLPCDNFGRYCSLKSICYKNKCVSCQDPNMIVYQDGTCRYEF